MSDNGFLKRAIAALTVSSLFIGVITSFGAGAWSVVGATPLTKHQELREDVESLHQNMRELQSDVESVDQGVNRNYCTIIGQMNNSTSIQECLEEQSRVNNE